MQSNNGLTTETITIVIIPTYIAGCPSMLSVIWHIFFVTILWGFSSI